MNKKWADKCATSMFTVIAAIIIAVLAGLIGYIFVRGLAQIDWAFLTNPPSSYRAGGGIGPQLFNSFYILFLTMLFTVPLGLGGGIYMAEYAKPGRVTDFIRTCIEVLASLPSIVVGLFGLLVFVQLTGWSYSILGGALALTVFNLPVMVRVVEDAITSVPREQKEASLALGITQWDTIRTVILPAAFPGILTGVILSAGRVFGEAAALLFTSGVTTPRLDWMNLNPFSETSPLNVFRPAETLAVHIWKINTQSLIPDAREVADGAALVLIFAVLLFNLLARLLGRYVHRKLTASK
ncbi:putative ABC transporter permease protein YqgI [Shouchella clausii]|uniref:phosphate ABC transporter permease PstA n=1 Tax=Shouchella clausii TaxID=79880 RepID=UPI000BA5153A|nr:phosphate ABC transporter permease PstA [Shouchella clausii]PAD47175.1 phosphate ABC transporter, permease protein PstA [Shouchella clausii]GIN16912.1 putative ABC transporter permease protein YqgI [Shouchella clausii]